MSAECIYYFRFNSLSVGVLASIFWFAAGTGSLMCAFFVSGKGIENYQNHLLACSSVFFVLMLAGLWLVVGYFRERLVITDTTITLYGVFHKKTLFLSDITKLVWFTRFGKIRLESPQSIMKISPGNLTDYERAEIVAFLYDSIDQKLHVDWPKFTENCVPIWGKHDLLTHPSLFVACVIPDFQLYTQTPEI